MKKKCLFALYAFDPFANANTNVALPLLNELIKFYDVDLVTLNNNNSAPVKEKLGNINIYRYKKQNKFFEKIQVLYYLDLTKKRPLKTQALLAVGKAISVFLHIFPFFKHPEYRELKRLLAQNQYSLIFSTCESFLSCWHLSILKKKRYFNAKFVVYFMDPFCLYYKNLDCKKYYVMEQNVYELSDLVLMTNEIYRQNLKNQFSVFIDKMRPFSFCNYKPYYEEFEWDGFVKDKINVVYAGSLISESVRDPSYFLRLAARFPDNIAVHMICNNISQEKKEKYFKITNINKNIFWHENISFQKCRKILCNSAILVNLSNRVSNQTPSKVFDYMSTGLPIINFYSIEDDCSNAYLKYYPLSLLINERDDIEANVSVILSFVENECKKHISKQAEDSLHHLFDSQRLVYNIVHDVNELVDTDE